MRETQEKQQWHAEQEQNRERASEHARRLELLRQPHLSLAAACGHLGCFICYTLEPLLCVTLNYDNPDTAERATEFYKVGGGLSEGLWPP